MKIYLLAATLMLHINGMAQSNTMSDIVEGGKTLVELVKIFKTPRSNIAPQPVVAATKDSCAAKSVTDFCIKNTGTKTIMVTLLRRNGNIYETGSLTLKVLPKSQEWLYEVKSGIYKMKMETEEDDVKKTIKEGEIKLVPCNSFIKEIKDEQE
ncbi:MAG: hypothetical protein JST86_04440 [Bacteroidetes bacterium]|nr:hypothetical protein [Bacteroidota bacterium]